jgi:hypothetical protein
MSHYTGIKPRPTHRAAALTARYKSTNHCQSRTFLISCSAQNGRAIAKTKWVTGAFLERVHTTRLTWWLRGGHRRRQCSSGAGHVCLNVRLAWTASQVLRTLQQVVIMLVTQIPHSPLHIHFARKHYKVISFPINLSPAALVGACCRVVLVAHHNVWVKGCDI